MKSEGTTRRILTFDLLRGYFLLSLIINHLQRFPNGLDVLTMRGQLYVSAAEGFFIVSGIILGIVRGAKLKDAPFKQAAKLLLQRGVQLYVWAVGLTILFSVIGWQFLEAERLKPGLLGPDVSLWNFWWQALSLQYTYGWADFLRLYAVFLVASPVVLWLLRAHKWWLAMLLSGLIWLVFDESIFARWQILFVSGLVLGYHSEQIRIWWAHIGKKWRRGISAALIGGAIVTFVGNVLLVFGPRLSVSLADFGALAPVITIYFDKGTMGIGRLLMAALWFSAAFLIVRHLETYIVRWFGWLLLTFGQNSLYVYILHSFVIFGLDLAVPERQLLLNILVSSAAIAGLWFVTSRGWLMKIIPR